jgi:hypothetical protein
MKEITTVVDGLAATAIVFSVLGIVTAFWGAVADNYGNKPEAFRTTRLGIVFGGVGIGLVLAAIWTKVLS